MLSLLACQAQPQASLLSLEPQEAMILRVGERTRVRCAGLMRDLEGRAWLEGEFYSAPASAKTVRVELAARSEDEETLSLRFDDEALRAFGGRGTFHGTLLIELEGSTGIQVRGDHALIADVFPREDVHTLSEDSERILAAETRFGLSAISLSEEPGLEVATLVEGGWAQRAGVQIGDQLRRVGGLRLRTLADLARISDARLSWTRPGVLGEIEAPCPRLLSEERASATTSGLSWLWLLPLPLLLGFVWIAEGSAPSAARERRVLPVLLGSALTLSLALSVGVHLVFMCVLLLALSLSRDRPREKAELLLAFLIAGSLCALTLGATQIAPILASPHLSTSDLVRYPLGLVLVCLLALSYHPGRELRALVWGAALTALTLATTEGAGIVSAIAAICVLFLGYLRHLDLKPLTRHALIATVAIAHLGLVLRGSCANKEQAALLLGAALVGLCAGALMNSRARVELYAPHL